MNLEYFFPSANVGDLYVNLTVETAGAQQCGVENIRAVGCRHNDNAVVLFKAVHLDKQLVERLFALVVTAAQARAALSADRVDFVDKNDTRHIVFRLVEQVAHTRCADADEHFDKVTAAYAENGTFASPATAFANNVLPVPGGPTSKTPLGILAPISTNFLGF